MNQIDHDPNEPKIDRSKGGWLSTFAVLGFGFIGLLYYGMIDWTSFFIGGALIGTFVAWATEYTGNKVPDSWRKKP